MAAPFRRIIVPLLLVLGAGWYILFHRPATVMQINILLPGAALALALIPAVRRPVMEVLERIRRPSPRSLQIATAVILLGSAGYFVVTAHGQGRGFFPGMQDENSYILQMRIMAQGSMWMPQHPLADFFESFHILVKPVYASIYFPGTALLNTPGVWLGLPLWVLPALAAGGVVALTYRITAELLDGAAGALAVVLMLAFQELRIYSVSVLSQVPAVLFGLLMIWCWLHWRRQRGWGWVLGIGVLAGWGAVIRPVDALCFALPIGLAMLWEMRSSGPARIATAGALLLAGAVPFFALQAVFNRGVTGGWTRTPYILYLEQNQPQTVFGFHDVDARPEPATELAQKRIYYEDWMIPQIYRHNEQAMWQTLLYLRLPQLLHVLLPSALLVALLPVGLAGLGDWRRWVMWGVLPLFVGLYALNTFFLDHYLIPLGPVVVFHLLMAVQAVKQRFAAVRETIETFLTLLLVAAGLAALPQVNPQVVDSYPYYTRQFVHEDLPELVEQPAVVLYIFTPGLNYHDEPVYNSDVAWPDDAPIINAHHLGDRNAELIEYYGRHQPQRHVYVIHRAEGEITYLGTAGELMRQVERKSGAYTVAP